ncbi:MAG TPA: hypothetical protein VFW71_06525 [Actinomycetota bacterium]|nr:hypothetical protein [Actinomycetota bacterium]
MPEDDEPEPRFMPTPIGRNGSSPEQPEDAPPVRRRSPLITFFLLLTAAAVVAPFIAVGVAWVTHAGPFSHTIFPVTLHNDGSAPVVIRACGANCAKGDQAITLQPGAGVQVGATNNGTISRYYVHDVTGTVLGCLPLVYHQTYRGLTVETSAAENCPGNPLPVPGVSPTTNPNIEGP